MRHYVGSCVICLVVCSVCHKPVALLRLVTAAKRTVHPIVEASLAKSMLLHYQAARPKEN